MGDAGDAMWNMQSIFSCISIGSVMSWWSVLRLGLPFRWSRFDERPVTRLSIEMISWLLFRRRSTRWEPMKPEPPVISIFDIVYRLFFIFLI